MKPLCLFAGLILVVFTAVGAQALPQTVRIPEQQHDSELLVQCGFDVFAPDPVYPTSSAQETSDQETSEKFSAPPESPPSVIAPDAQIPEPGSGLLVVCGLFIGGLLGLRRRAKRKRSHTSGNHV